LALTIILCAGVLVDCGGLSRQALELPPPEVFTWTGGQPISFSPPSGEWKRSRYQNGGAEGVDFVLSGSKGEMIFVAERFFLGRRDRCAQIRKILEGLDDCTRHSFTSDLHKARLNMSEPLNDYEAQPAEVVNGMLDDAREAYLDGNLEFARADLKRALEEAGNIRYSVKETVGEVLFTAERNSVFPALEVDAPVEGSVAGEPAVIVKFSFNGHGSPMVGRRVYTVKNNRMFEIGFQGLQEHLPLFDGIVASITFPPGSCEH
jgi:hypothetical protein